MSITTATSTDEGDTAPVEAIEADDDDAGAVSSSVFTVTATPDKMADGSDPDDECGTVSGETEVGDDGSNSVELKLVDTTLGGGQCQYTISTSLPDGFAAGDGTKSTAAAAQAKGVNPGPVDEHRGC